MIKDLPDPEGYIANLVTILVGFTLEEARAGVEWAAVHCPYLPTRFELHNACQRHRTETAAARAKRARLAAQLAERDQLEAPRGPTQTVEEVRAEMRARGLEMPSHRAGDRPHTETPMSAMVKLGLSQEEWDAIPDAPTRGGDHA